jgi:hypothetical protein
MNIMSYHFGNNEYRHLIGKKMIRTDNKVVVIKDIYSDPDEIYSVTDGNAGNAYTIVFDNQDKIQFRSIWQILEKYGTFYEEYKMR